MLSNDVLAVFACVGFIYWMVTAMVHVVTFFAKNVWQPVVVLAMSWPARVQSPRASQGTVGRRTWRELYCRPRVIHNVQS